MYTHTHTRARVCADWLSDSLGCVRLARTVCGPISLNSLFAFVWQPTFNSISMVHLSHTQTAAHHSQLVVNTLCGVPILNMSERPQRPREQLHNIIEAYLFQVLLEEIRTK